MPKIDIREIDATKSGSTTYKNYSVVVPGLVSPSIPTSELLFDDNGVYTCFTQAAFESHVGKVAATTSSVTAAAPTLTILNSSAANDWDKTHTTLSANDYYVTYKNSLYSWAEAPAGTTSVGRLISHETSSESGATAKYYKYTAIDTTSTEWNSTTKYAVIASGNEGRDAVAACPQMGNQIAYELLGMGFTVLYVTMGTNASTGMEAIKTSTFWEPLKDKSLYDYRYIVTGLFSGSDSDTVAGQAISVASNRKDCVALVDINDSYYAGGGSKTQSAVVANIISGIGAISFGDGGNYSAVFAPSVTYEGTPDTVYNNLKFPASFHYLSCAASAFANFNEWYAVGGYQRGVGSRGIASVSAVLGDYALNLLEPRTSSTAGASSRAVNIIIKRSDKFYLWGNRTAHTIGAELVSSDFLNIRQLCTTIKKQLYVACNSATFDPNSDTLWYNFRNSITPTLETMKADQGIRDYKIFKRATDKKGVLAAVIRIVPIEAVEDFDITITLEDSLDGNIVINE